MIEVVVLLSVLVVTVGVVIVAYRERARLALEVGAVVSGIERRTGLPGSQKVSAHCSPHLQELLDEAVQIEQQGLAVLAVSELTGRASLARHRGLLFARGLGKIALLSGGGGAFVLVAVGNFERQALIQGGVSVIMGLSSSFLCHGLTASVRRLARKYCDIIEVLARQLDRQINSGGPSE